MVSHIPSCCVHPSSSDKSLEPEIAGTRYGGPAGTNQPGLISLWPPAKIWHGHCIPTLQGPALGDTLASFPADGQQLARCWQQSHGADGSTSPLLLSVTQATRLRPASSWQMAPRQSQKRQTQSEAFWGLPEQPVSPREGEVSLHNPRKPFP